MLVVLKVTVENHERSNSVEKTTSNCISRMKNMITSQKIPQVPNPYYCYCHLIKLITESIGK